MSYILCGLLDDLGHEFSSDAPFPIDSVMFSNDADFVNLIRDGAEVSAVPRTTKFKVMNVETFKISTIDLEELKHLHCNGLLLGEQSVNSILFTYKVISPVGYAFTSILTKCCYDKPLSRRNIHFKLFSVKTFYLAFRDSYLGTEEFGLFFDTSIADPDISYMVRGYHNIYIGDYLSYVFSKVPVELIPYIVEFEGDTLKLWNIARGVSKDSLFSQHNCMTFKVNDMNKFKSLVSKSKLLGGSI